MMRVQDPEQRAARRQPGPVRRSDHARGSHRGPLRLMATRHL